MSQEAGIRRNGKQQACEPCRKGKMRCDHALPFCGRCTRRRMTSKCIYHPAPMTKERRPAPTPSTQPLSRPTRTPASRNQASSQDKSQPNAKLPPSIGVSLTARNTRRTSLFKRQAAFQGPTSFSAIHAENSATFSLGASDLDKEAETEANTTSSRAPSPHPLLSDANIALGTKALLNFPNKSFCSRLAENFSILHEITLMEPLITRAVDSLWDVWGAELAEPRSEKGVAGVVERLSFNGLNAAKGRGEGEEEEGERDAESWMEMFVGGNMRWEVLGVVFSCLGMGCMALQEGDEFLSGDGTKEGRKEAAWRMKECTDVCLAMCDDVLNEFVVLLMMNNMILESYCVGDESHQVWRRHGELVGAVLSSGLHRLPDPATTATTLPAWFRSRLFSACYVLDKSHSVFNGVPPGLSRHYCNLGIPLDLDVNEIIAGSEELALAISRLDDQGWNTSGKIHSVTPQRALMIFFVIREEILEISLGVKVVLTNSHIQELLQRCDKVYVNLPSQLQYRPEKEMQSTNSYHHYIIVSTRLHYLQNCFLLHRVAVGRLNAHGQGLLDCAREQMDLILDLWLKRDYLLSSTMNFDWILTAYGIPCSGVLCLELLKQSRTPHESNVYFSRAEVVRKLTIFIAFSEWVRPSDGNYMLHQRHAKVVQRIIDHVLDQPLESVPQAMGLDVPGMNVDPMLLPFDQFDAMGWLNTVDWTHGALMDMH